jgi:XRE family transcriptional regulator, regulator of sulfur utilization
MITRRDLSIAIISSAVALGVAAFANQQTSVMQSSAFDWNAVPAKATDVGEVREFFRAPTATLPELELHVTTLNPGLASHPPHRHAHEELFIVKEGTVEVLVNGDWKKLGPGSVGFNGSDQLHGIRNPGPGKASYHVISWRSPGMKPEAE